jgi:hypothetical protein
VIAVAVVLVAAVSAAGAMARGSHPASRMLVYAQEWSLWSSRHALPHGRVIVQLWNRGQDSHDLHIRRLGRHGHMVGDAQTVAVTISGAIRQATWRLTPGRYELFCSMPGHLAMGMHTVVIVH